MAHGLTWSRRARGDLRALTLAISSDSPRRAEAFALRLIDRVEALANEPELGRSLSASPRGQLRQLTIAPYRVIYRVRPEVAIVEIVRVWHGARREPDLE